MLLPKLVGGQVPTRKSRLIKWIQVECSQEAFLGLLELVVGKKTESMVCK